MQYVTLKYKNKPVSRFGMGCMRLPQIKKSDGTEIIDEQESIRMIRYAIENGVNYFDTAYSYTGSERVLGKALLDGYRQKVYIATKCPVWYVKTGADYGRFIDEQRKRLRSDYIDVYLFHCLDRANWERVKATDGIKRLEELKQRGVIGQIGFSFHGEQRLFIEIIDSFKWDICLIQLNILDDDYQAGMAGLKYAASKDISVAIMEPLKGGLLGGSAPKEAEALLNSYEEIRPLHEWAFRWLYHHAEAAVILSGVSSMEQLKDNLRIFGEAKPGVMSDRDMELIRQIKYIYAGKVKIPCTGCGYCMPCPAGVNIPEIFKAYNDSPILSWKEFIKTFYSLETDSPCKDAVNCTGCGHCESQCPQNIKIADMLKKARGVMGRG